MEQFQALLRGSTVRSVHLETALAPRTREGGLRGRPTRVIFTVQWRWPDTRTLLRVGWQEVALHACGYSEDAERFWLLHLPNLSGRTLMVVQNHFVSADSLGTLRDLIPPGKGTWPGAVLGPPPAAMLHSRGRAWYRRITLGSTLPRQDALEQLRESALANHFQNGALLTVPTGMIHTDDIVLERPQPGRSVLWRAPEFLGEVELGPGAQLVAGACTAHDDCLEHPELALACTGEAPGRWPLHGPAPSW